MKLDTKWVPEYGQLYFRPNVDADIVHRVLNSEESLYLECKWEHDDFDALRLERGWVYPHTEQGREKAIAHAKRMLNA